MSRYSENSRSRNASSFDHRRRYEEERTHSRIDKPSKRFKDSFSKSRTVEEIEDHGHPTCRISSCKWTGFDEELYGHCMRHHNANIIQSNDEDKIKFDYNKQSDVFETVLMKFNSVLLWLHIKNDGCDVHFIVQYAGVSKKQKRFKYSISLGSNKQEFGVEICAIAPNDLLSVQDLCKRYLVKLNRKKLFDHLSCTLAITPDSSSSGAKPLAYVQRTFGSDSAKEKAEEAMREFFTCPICMDFVRKEARFCVRKHIVCYACYPRLTECPLCRGPYGKNRRNEETERFLKYLHFPAKEDDDV